MRTVDVALDATGAEVLARVRVENGTNAPVVAITGPRRIVYRDDAKTLQLTLVEKVAVPDGSSADWHYFAPAQTELAALRGETIELRRPRVQKQVLDVASPSGLVEHRLYESRQVDVSLAWSDVPMRPDPEVTSKCAVDEPERRGETTRRRDGKLEVAGARFRSSGHVSQRG